MEETLRKAIFNDLFLGVDGYLLADLSKRKFNLKENAEFTYGEINFDEFAKILQEAEIKSNQQVFYDLGSGVGKAVMAAALSGYFKKVCGIELLPDLFQASEKVLTRFNQEVKSLFLEAEKLEIIFRNENFFETDFSDVDVVFIQCTCMKDEIMNKLAGKLEVLKSGSLVLTATKKLPSEKFVIKKVAEHQLGWGKATIYFQIKI